MQALNLKLPGPLAGDAELLANGLQGLALGPPL